MKEKERRIRRSHQKGPALSLQLQACVERSALEAMILADGDGLIVASSPFDEESTERIAAMLAQMDNKVPPVTTVKDAGLEKIVTVHGFKIGDQPLILCAVGEPNEKTDEEIQAAVGGIERIICS